MIKVLISTKKFKGGPSIFRNRIAAALNAIDDIEVVRRHEEKFDIELSVIRHLNEHKKPKILRVDGCYYTSGNLKMNNGLAKAMRQANHVIFQSYFSKKMCYSILKMKPKHHSTIRNGIDFDYVDRIRVHENIPPGSFAAAASWRDSKRPESMLNGFVKSGVKGHFYVIGSGINHKWKNHKNIHLMGACSEVETIGIMKACDYMLHLCYIDSCPNAVVEGLACNLNVLCTNLGGTKELVEDSGIVMEVDKWSGKPVNTKSFDSLSADKIARGIRQLIALPKHERRDDINIKNVAEKYAKVIRQVVS